MESLIKTRKIKGKKGKARWRKGVDTQELENQYSDNIVPKITKKAISKGKLDFHIETKPIIEEKRKVLDPKRFQKKVRIDPSKYNKNLIIKKAKALESNLEKKNSDSTAEEQINSIPSNNKIGNPKMTRPSNKVTIPHSGESYNPSIQAYSELAQKIINMEIKKDKKLESNLEKAKIAKASKPKKIIKKKLPKAKSLRGKLAQELILKNRDDKKHSHQFNLINSYKKQISTSKKELEETKLKNKIISDLKKKDKEDGIAAIKLSGKIIEPHIPSMKLLSEEEPTLRELKPKSSLLKEAFVNYARKGVIEKMTLLPKKQKPKIFRKKEFEKRSWAQEAENEFDIGFN